MNKTPDYVNEGHRSMPIETEIYRNFLLPTSYFEFALEKRRSRRESQKSCLEDKRKTERLCRFDSSSLYIKEGIVKIMP